MGHGYAILIWDGWGAGLVRINPRLYTVGNDCYGNPCNWFSCDYDMGETEARLLHGLNNKDYPYLQVIN